MKKTSRTLTESKDVAEK